MRVWSICIWKPFFSSLSVADLVFLQKMILDNVKWEGSLSKAFNKASNCSPTECPEACLPRQPFFSGRLPASWSFLQGIPAILDVLSWLALHDVLSFIFFIYV